MWTSHSFKMLKGVHGKRIKSKMPYLQNFNKFCITRRLVKAISTLIGSMPFISFFQAIRGGITFGNWRRKFWIALRSKGT